MTSPLGLGAVSAVLRNLLDNGLIDAGAALGTVVNVSAVAPDTINLDEADDPPRLNLFLHQVTHNSGWRNRELPSRNANGDRVTNHPLALDMHYLLTAYTRTDCQAEVLLGYAMHLLHERPVLDRAAIRRALDPSPLDISMLPQLFQALRAADLAEQIEALKITPAMLSLDEMSKLWSSIQTHYRPSVGYQVSVVLIEGQQPALNPLPVLSRHIRVNPNLLPASPTLMSIAPAARQPAARLGETVTVTGIHLEGANPRVRLFHRLLQNPVNLPVAVNATGTGFTFELPNDPPAQVALPAGLWRVSYLVTPPGEPLERETNSLGLQIAPAPVLVVTGLPLNLPAPAITREAGPPAHVRVRLASRPQVQLRQDARLVIDTHEAAAQPRAAATDLLEFRLPAALADGEAYVRLRVDGVDSILIRRDPPPAIFDPTQVVIIPP